MALILPGLVINLVPNFVSDWARPTLVPRPVFLSLFLYGLLFTGTTSFFFYHIRGNLCIYSSFFFVLSRHPSSTPQSPRLLRQIRLSCNHVVSNLLDILSRPPNPCDMASACFFLKG